MMEERKYRVESLRGRVLQGDCVEKLKSFPDNSIDAVVTDPPYGLVSIVKRFGKEGSAPAKFGTDGAFARASKGFMGKEWDGSGVEYSPELWAEVYRVMKPGAHLLSFGGTRTYHRMVCAVEDAGFEIRDTVVWHYGSGFPKSLDVSKAMDKAVGAEREVVGKKTNIALGKGLGKNFRDDGWRPPEGEDDPRLSVTVPSTDDAKRWSGWGTALKPATELIVLARKSLSEPTVAANVLKWGTGALNIDASRIGVEQTTTIRAGHSGDHGRFGKDNRKFERVNPPGRFPANLILDEEAGKMLDEQSGVLKSEKPGVMRLGKNTSAAYGKESRTAGTPMSGFGDSGGASRFFYCAKASGWERDAGLDKDCTHPTVKPISLIRYLIRMVTPPGGTVLDPFVGSGTTLCAVETLKAEGVDVHGIGIEKEQEYVGIANARVAWYRDHSNEWLKRNKKEKGNAESMGSESEVLDRGDRGAGLDGGAVAVEVSAPHDDVAGSPATRERRPRASVRVGRGRRRS